MEFLNQTFGRGLLSGSLNILLWISYVVMLALYAYAFGSYGAEMIQSDPSPLLRHTLISAAVIVLTVLNAAGASAVGRAEIWIVAGKLAILALFVVAGLGTLEPARLAPDAWAAPLGLAGGGMLIFLAYEGFELIANTARDVARPRRNLPRAYFSPWAQ